MKMKKPLEKIKDCFDQLGKEKKTKIVIDFCNYSSVDGDFYLPRLHDMCSSEPELKNPVQEPPRLIDEDETLKILEKLGDEKATMILTECINPQGHGIDFQLLQKKAMEELAAIKGKKPISEADQRKLLHDAIEIGKKRARYDEENDYEPQEKAIMKINIVVRGYDLPEAMKRIMARENGSKPANPPRRSRKEVREEARRIQKADRDRCEQHSSADQLIGSGAGKSPARKAKRKFDGPIKLPERFEILCKFFESLDSSIRLLRIRGSVSTFTNISPKVQHFTDRRFTYGHLAQLKHIVPEVFELKKILVHDDRTSSMKPELLVDLKLDALENDGKSSDRNSHARKVFRARLLEYSKIHPEGEVPEDELPEPFNCSKQALLPSMANASSSSLREASTGLLSGMQPVAASHLPPSYRKHFSLSNRQVSKPLTLDITEEAVEESSTQKCDSSKATAMKSGSISDIFKATPLKSDKSESFKETPMKSLMTTLAQLPQKRHYVTPDDKSIASPNKLVTRRPCNRPLKFDTPVKKNTKAKGEDYCTGGLSIDDDIFNILPASLCQSISEKEKKILEEQDPAISQAKKRRKMLASLPKLSDMIIFFFQSINRSVVTKEELMHRIIGSFLDIVDRSEVEEQLCLMEELVPGWIQEKPAATGDLLIRVNKMLSPELIRSRIAEAGCSLEG